MSTSLDFCHASHVSNTTDKRLHTCSLPNSYRLFVSNESVSVVLQNAAGGEVHFTVGDQEGATLTWAEFHNTCQKDAKSQNYAKSVAECLGVLGDRFIMEVGRINQTGEVYMEAFSLVTLTPEGKISMLEAFSDVNASGLLQAAQETE